MKTEKNKSTFGRRWYDGNQSLVLLKESSGDTKENSKFKNKKFKIFKKFLKILDRVLNSKETQERRKNANS